MQESMEANQESPLSTTNSFFSTGDSSLLSNYLNLQAQNAGNRLFYHRKPMILSHSKILLTPVPQSEPPWLSSSSAALSSANSLPWASFTALKESSESFIARECSSQVLSELDQSRGDSVFLHKTPPLSSFSCIESSECYESGAETTTGINVNGDSLRCSKSKKVDAWADHRRRVLNAHTGVSADNMEVCDHEEPSNTLYNIAPTDNKVAVDHNASTESMIGFQHRGPLDNRVLSGYRVSSNKIEALDLLIYAAIQVGLLDDEDDQNCDASLRRAKRTDCATSDACHERHVDGFPVHLNSSILKKRVVRRARSAFSKRTGSDLLQRLGISSPAKTSDKKVNIKVEKDDNSINNCKADLTQQQRKAIQYTRRRTLKMFPERVVACKTDVSEMIHVENGDGSKKGGLQVSPTKKSDACNTYLKGLQVKESQCKTPMKQQNLQVLPSPELPGPLSKPLENAMKSEMCKDLYLVESARGQKNGILEEKCRQANSGVEAQHVAPVKNGGSLIKLKIRPMRWSSQVLQEANTCEHDSESNTITRRSKRLHVGEHERKTNVTMQPIGLTQCDSSGSLDTEAKDADLLIRSKRARSQVLPTKFCDSVLQPWKRAYRKKC